MTWEHSEKTHSNWREAIRNALQEGKLTTVITFDGTRYLVTLQPHDPATATTPVRKNENTDKS